MRKYIVLLAFLVCTTPISADEVDDQIAMVRQVTATERDAMVRANMALSAAEGEKFWPIHAKYRQSMKELGDRRVELIKDYVSNHKDMDDNKAREIIEEWFEIEQDTLQTRQRYARKFRKVVSEIKVARWLQIENKIDSVYKLELSRQIPLAH
jgi:hypothetical protein